MRFTDDYERVHKIINRLEVNGGYCPCNFEKTEDTVCPCREMLENKACHCGLFV